MNPRALRNGLIYSLIFWALLFYGVAKACAQEGTQDGKASTAGQSLPLSVAGDRPASPGFKALTAGFLGLAAADFAISNACIQKGRCYEQGPLYRGVANHPLAFATVKAGASAALATTAWSIRKKHPRAAWAVLVGLTAAQGYVVFHNLKVTR